MNFLDDCLCVADVMMIMMMMMWLCVVVVVVDVVMWNGFFGVWCDRDGVMCLVLMHRVRDGSQTIRSGSGLGFDLWLATTHCGLL